MGQKVVNTGNDWQYWEQQSSLFPLVIVYIYMKIIERKCQEHLWKGPDNLKKERSLTGAPQHAI